jgi:uncharacterized protein DUF4262
MEVRDQAFLDQMDANMVAQVRRFGWSVQYVGGEQCAVPWCDCHQDSRPAFAYTVGLFGLSHPELLVFGLDLDTAFNLLNHLSEQVRSGEPLLPGQLLTFRAWPHRVVPEEVPNPGDIVFRANDFYRRPDAASVPVLQLTYDDTAGRFPWDADYAAPGRQPRPGTFRA